MPLSGYSTALPNDILLNPAIICVGSVVIGATKGGVSWDSQIATSEVQFDGMRSKVKGLERKTKHGGKLSGQLIQFATAAEIARVEAGSTTATSTATGISSVITPKGAGILFASGDYLTDLRAVWETGAGVGNYIAIHMAAAICTKWTLKGADNGEADVTFEFDAVLDMSVSGTKITDAPYNIEIRTALP